MNNNKEDLESKQYDIIVVGTGISGDWAAKELCGQSLKNLVLERGTMIKDYPTAHLDPWGLPNGGETTRETRERKQQSYTFNFIQ